MGDGYPVEVACRVVGVSVSGYYCWRRRPPSARSVRHGLLLDVIAEIHQASRRTYGARRIHAELVHGRGLQVARCTVELVMRRNGLAGLPGPAPMSQGPEPAHRNTPGQPTERRRLRELARHALRQHLGQAGVHRLTIRIDQVNHRDVCRIDVPASSRPIWVEIKDGSHILYQRRNNSTRPVPSADVRQFIVDRFRSDWAD